MFRATLVFIARTSGSETLLRSSERQVRAKSPELRTIREPLMVLKKADRLRCELPYLVYGLWSTNVATETELTVQSTKICGPQGQSTTFLIFRSTLRTTARTGGFELRDGGARAKLLN